MTESKPIRKGDVVQIADPGDYYNGKFASVVHTTPGDVALTIYKDQVCEDAYQGVFTYTRRQVVRVEETAIGA